MWVAQSVPENKEENGPRSWRRCRREMQESSKREDTLVVAKERGKVRRGTENFLMRSIEEEGERVLNLIMAGELCRRRDVPMDSWL